VNGKTRIQSATPDSKRLSNLPEWDDLASAREKPHSRRPCEKRRPSRRNGLRMIDLGASELKKLADKFGAIDASALFWSSLRIWRGYIWTR